MGKVIGTSELSRSRYNTRMIAIAAKLHPKLLYLRPRLMIISLHRKMIFITSLNDRPKLAPG